MSTTTTAVTIQEGSPSVPLETIGRHEPILRGQSAATTYDNDNEPSPSPHDTAAASRLDRRTILKLLSAGISFFVAGVNDGSLGALIPHLIRSYGITTAVVSSLYGAALGGWLLAAVTATHLSQRLRLGSMLALGALLQTAAQALRAWPVPPFGLYVSTFLLASLGQAYQDTYANTFVASLFEVGGSESEGRGGGKSAHRWLGFIHAMYMAGCLVAPFGAASIAATSGDAREGSSKWWLFYTVPLGLGVMNLGLVLVAFRDMLGFAGGNKRTAQAVNAGEEEGRKSASRLIRDALRKQNVWLLSMFFFFYLGVVVTAGGWVVEYLVDARNGDIAQMGYVPAGFSGGCLLGRILLPEPTHRFGEKKMVSLYCVLCLGFQLIFWLVPNIIAASIAISLLGFFSGPFFATAVSVGTRLFPAEISATAISFVFVFAQMGGSLFPIVTGVLGAKAGVSVMQPILVGLIAAMTISWLLVPQPKGKMK